MGAVDHAAELAGVEEKNFAAAVAEAWGGGPPPAPPPGGGGGVWWGGGGGVVGGVGGGVKELARKRDHAIDKIGFDDVLSDFAFTGLV